MKLEAELNRIHGRIIKLLDSIKGYELESRRVRLEERKYNLAKQKLSGAFAGPPQSLFRRATAAPGVRTRPKTGQPLSRRKVSSPAPSFRSCFGNLPHTKNAPESAEAFKKISWLKKRRGPEPARNTERAKLVRAKRKNEEYELQLKENKLHAAEDIEAVMTDMLVNFKSRLMAIPSKLAPVLCKKTDKAEIFALLKDHIDEALMELSDFKTAFGERAKDEESDG